MFRPTLSFPLRLLAGLAPAFAPLAASSAQRSSPDAPGGLPRHASFGVALGQDSSDTAPGRVVVQRVTPGRTGAVLGIKAGDRILALNDSAVGDVGSFIGRSSAIFAGQEVRLSVRRGAQTLALKGRATGRPLESAAGLVVEYGAVEGTGVRRRTITVRPTNPGRHPGVLFIGGLGCSSLDGIDPADGYGGLIYGLARAGYSV